MSVDKQESAFQRAMSVHLAGIKHDMDYSQRAIAQQMGIPGSYLSVIKRGDKEVTLGFVEKWCDWLHENDGGLSEDQRKAWHRLGAISRGWKL